MFQVGRWEWVSMCAVNRSPDSIKGAVNGMLHHWYRYDRCCTKTLQTDLRTGKICCLICPSIFEAAAFATRFRTALMKCITHPFFAFRLKAMQAGISTQASFRHDTARGNTHDEKQGKQNPEFSSIWHDFSGNLNNCYLLCVKKLYINCLTILNGNKNGYIFTI